MPVPTRKHTSAHTLAGHTPRISSAQSGTEASQATAWLWIPPSMSVSWVKPAAIVPTTRCPTNPSDPVRRSSHGTKAKIALHTTMTTAPCVCPITA
jgi:hypothetical protein